MAQATWHMHHAHESVQLSQHADVLYTPPLHTLCITAAGPTAHSKHAHMLSVLPTCSRMEWKPLRLM